MTPAKVNLTVYQGATFKKEFQWTTTADKIPVDITGLHIRMQIREKLKDVTFVIELTTENSRIIISNPTEGRFYLILSAELTSVLLIKHGVYDIEVMFSDGFVERIIEGSVSVSPQVTR